MRLGVMRSSLCYPSPHYHTLLHSLPPPPPALFVLVLACTGTAQHALLVHEGGFFSDEKGRLGCFPTLDELLKSKIKALARHPLTFRREGNRCDRCWLPL